VRNVRIRCCDDDIDEDFLDENEEAWEDACCEDPYGNDEDETERDNG